MWKREGLHCLYMDRLGIDIGTVSVKYVRWNDRKGGGGIVSKGAYPYSGETSGLTEILSAIRGTEGQLLEVSIGLTSQEILKKTFTIPVIPKNEMEQAIQWAASKVATSPLEEMVYETTVLGEITERGIKKLEVLFTGVEKRIVDAVLAAFHGTGFRRIRLFTDTAFIYASAVESAAEGSTVVIDVGGRQSGIYIYDDQKLKLVREINTASESFTDALMSGLNLSYENATKYKREYGFNEATTPALSLPLDRLVGEIQRTFGVYNQKYPQTPVRKAFLAGQGSNIQNLCSVLKDFFAEPFGTLTTPAGVQAPFLPAYILATRPEGLTNLLPKEIKDEKREETYKKWSRLCAISVAAILLIVSIGLFGRLHKAESMIRVEQTIKVQKENELALYMGTASFPHQEEYAAIQEEIRTRDTTLIVLMKYLSASLPPNVSLMELEFDRYGRDDGTTKGMQKETHPGEGRASKDPATPGKMPLSVRRQTTADQDRILEKDYGVVLRGHIYGTMEIQEPTLISTLMQLSRSGFLYQLEVVQRQIRKVRGENILEFRIKARCLVYEI
jgi:Tfp pilus assembly PilM family ATPase